MKKRTLFSFALLTCLVLSSCKKKVESQAEQAPPPAEVDIITAVSEQIPVNTRLPGRLEPYRQAEVRARVTGIVLKRCYEEGQSVKEGDLLFQIDPAPLKATLDGCEAELARAEANLNDAMDKLNRYNSLVNNGAVSKREHTLAIAEKARAKAEKDAALAAKERAQLELGYANVTAPISGTVRRALVTEGAYVNQNESTHLTTIEQINPIFIRFSQPVSELSSRQRSILSGKWESIPLEKVKVNLLLPDGRTYQHEGKLFFSDRSVDPQTDTVEMRAEFPNSDFELLPGTYVRVSFDSAIRKNIFRIPRDAVTRTSQGASVMIVNDKNTTEILPVTTEELEGRNWLVTQGLKGGERIIVSKKTGLFPGSPVLVSQTPTAPVPDKAQASVSGSTQNH